MKTILFLFITIILTQSSFAQKRCGTSEMVQKKINSNLDYKIYRDQLNQFTAEWNASNNVNKTNEVITVSVVVHVLHKGGSDNISDEQIQSQFVVLNDDFRKMNANFSSTPMAFQSLAADTEIEFCLAGIDPDGNSTTGITRKQVPNNFDPENDYYDDSFGGQTAWDETKYLNIWITDLDALGLLGFATPPGLATSGDDGAVIDHKAFGTIGTAVNNAPNHLGRTATHEIGHYFNLEHVWGPTNGGCGEDDGVSDTPNQDTETGGCPTFPLTDACTTSGDGIMYVNYLDYSNDDCMTMFTLGQKSRMLAALNGPRAGLKTSNACGEGTSISSNGNTKISIDIFPNPSNKFINIELSNTDKNLKIELLNSIGQVITQKIYNSNTNENIHFDVSNLNFGIYFVQLTSENESFVSLKKFLVK